MTEPTKLQILLEKFNDNYKNNIVKKNYYAASKDNPYKELFNMSTISKNNKYLQLPNDYNTKYKNISDEMEKLQGNYRFKYLRFYRVFYNYFLNIGTSTSSASPGQYGGLSEEDIEAHIQKMAKYADKFKDIKIEKSPNELINQISNEYGIKIKEKIERIFKACFGYYDDKKPLKRTRRPDVQDNNIKKVYSKILLKLKQNPPHPYIDFLSNYIIWADSSLKINSSMNIINTSIKAILNRKNNNQHHGLYFFLLYEILDNPEYLKLIDPNLTPVVNSTSTSASQGNTLYEFKWYGDPPIDDNDIKQIKSNIIYYDNISKELIEIGKEILKLEKMNAIDERKKEYRENIKKLKDGIYDLKDELGSINLNYGLLAGEDYYKKFIDRDIYSRRQGFPKKVAELSERDIVRYLSEIRNLINNINIRVDKDLYLKYPNKSYLKHFPKEILEENKIMNFMEKSGFNKNRTRYVIILVLIVLFLIPIGIPATIAYIRTIS